MRNTRLRDICEVITKGTTPTTVGFSFVETGINFIKIENIDEKGNVDIDNIAHINEECHAALKRSQLREGDILFSIAGAIGRTAIVNNDMLPANTNQALAIIRINDNSVNREYLRLFLTSTVVKKQTERQKQGIAQVNLSLKNIGDLVVNLPNYTEQGEIVKELNTILLGINEKKQVVSSLDELVKSRFIEMFGEPLSESYITPFSQACFFNPKKSEKKDWTDETIISFIPMPLVSEHGEINTGTLKTYKEVKTGFTYFRENDVLFAKITPCMENGKGAIAQNLKNGIGFGSTEFHVLRPIEGVSNPYWIYYLTAIDSFRIMAEKKMTGSAGQKRVPISFFENMKVNLPPIKLQNEFAKFVKLIDKSKFVCHSKNFLCDIFTFSSSTIAYPSVVSIFVCPKRC